MKELHEHIEEVEEQIGYSFENKDLLLQAFTRSSYSVQYGGENNEVLEFLGDRVLDFYVVKIMADEFGFTKSNSDYYDEDNDLDEFCIVAHKDEADFTGIKNNLVSNENLARRIDKMHLAQYMYLGDSDIDNHVEKNTKAKADLFEAILGAVAIDSDWDPETLKDIVADMLQIDDYLDDVDTEEERPDKFKIEHSITALKELAEHGVCSVPEYDMSEEQEWFDGEYQWRCTCTVKSWNLSFNGYAGSKKEAKRVAAHAVICAHYNIKDELD